MYDTTYRYDALGRRLYLTPGEREVFLRTALGHDRPVRTFCSLLYYTGCRISEALHVTPQTGGFCRPGDHCGKPQKTSERYVPHHTGTPLPVGHARHGARP